MNYQKIDATLRAQIDPQKPKRKLTFFLIVIPNYVPLPEQAIEEIKNLEDDIVISNLNRQTMTVRATLTAIEALSTLPWVVSLRGSSQLNPL